MKQQGTDTTNDESELEAAFSSVEEVIAFVETIDKDKRYLHYVILKI